ncbi:MAG: protein kinase [Planctomycetia bacterium]|nr:protein kinase [Planctomycetia bacterium]
MGVVWEADQVEPIRRHVAVKFVKLGMDSRQVMARFEAERQALALMDHPNIAKVYDAGLTSAGKPYFAMELVKGLSITKYCDEAKLTIRQRMELFLLVCNAVQHAHQKGVIHRDLKPTNVLVALYDGKPIPKVIDFGLAKALHQPLTNRTIFTEQGMMLGTPEYMAPEQASVNALDIDTRADIYSLGVILYELMTGQVPFERKELRQAMYDEMLRMIREVEPPIPSKRLSSIATLSDTAIRRGLEPKSLVSTLRGDIDWIVMKALEKDRNRRYETANGFGMDVQRYLDGKAVLAHPPSRLYLAQKFVRRNRGRVFAGGLVVIALLAGLAVSLWQMNRAIDAEALAKKNEEKAENRAIDVQEEKKRTEEKSLEIRKEKYRLEQLLAMQASREGLRMFYEGDPYKGQLWLAHSLVIAPDHFEMVKITRQRIRAYQKLSLLRTYWRHNFNHQRAVNIASFSVDGQRVVTASDDNTAKVWDAITGKLIKTLDHSSGVKCASFSPDGLRIVTTSEDNKANVWDVATGKLIAKLEHTKFVHHATFSPDGQQIVTASSDKSVIVWNLFTGERIRNLKHWSEVKDVAFSSDGRFILTLTDSYACAWNASTGQPTTDELRHVLDDGKYSLYSASISKDGRYVVTTGLDMRARIWNTITGKPITSLLHAMRVIHASFSPDGSRIVTGSEDGVAIVWDVDSGRPITTPLQHEGSVMHTAFSPDGRWIITSSEDSTARVWNATTGQLVMPPLKHGNSVLHAEFSMDGRRVITSSKDNTARVWEVAITSLSSLSMRHNDRVFTASFSPDSQCVITASNDKTARIWSATSGKPLLPPLIHADSVHFAAFSPDGSRVITASKDKTAQVWSTKNGQPTTPPLLHKAGLTHASINPDSRRIVTTGIENTAMVWDAIKGSPLLTLVDDKRPLPFMVSSGVFSPDGQLIALVSDNSDATIWNAVTGKLIARLEHLHQVYSASFSPDSQYIVTASADKTAKLWNIQTGQLVTPPLQHENSVIRAVFSPDGKSIVTASLDNSARVWDVATGQPRTQLMKHKGIVTYVSFSPDGEKLVTASFDNSARVWDVVTGQPLTPALCHKSYVFCASFSPNGRYVLTASNDNTARVWSLPIDERPIADLLHLAQVNSGYIIDGSGELKPLSTEDDRITRYNELKTKYPEEFNPDVADIRCWREEQIRQCIKDMQLEAALFHQNWLLAEAVLEAAKTNSKR